MEDGLEEAVEEEGRVAREEFAALLKELKDRSGLSYGVLARRLHLSGSTLHRYVNGDAVPTDYAPVERFARLCKATPEELLTLHQLWVRADVLRRSGRGADREPPPAPGPATASAPAPDPGPTAASGPTAGSGTSADSGPPPGPEPVPHTGPVPPTPGPTSAPAPAPASVPEAEGGTGGGAQGTPEAEPPALPAVSGPVPPDAAPQRRRHRRTVALAGGAVAAAGVALALVVNLLPGGEDDGGREGQTVGAASTLDETPDTGPPPSTTPEDSEKPTTPESTPSPSTGPDASRGVSEAPGGTPADGGATAPTVATDAYRWEDQCSQHYLVNRPPEQVPPPPTEQDARGWAVALDAVPGGDQLLALTVQGTGRETVVLKALHVRVVDRGEPLAWNDYAMGVGCGGEVSTTSFDVDLDSGRPDATPTSGQRDFPYKVSESDPEVFYVTAHAQEHTVSWYLELDWSSGQRHGTVRIDDAGEPFRTSGNRDRPAYNYPLGTTEWDEAPKDPGQ